MRSWARWSMLSVLLLVHAPLLAQVPDWSTVIRPAARQVVRLEMLRQGKDTPGICTGIVINADQGYVLTAAHCVTKPQTETISITANDRHADMLRINDLLDLAVLRTQLRGEEQMGLADKTPMAGTPIAIVGFAYGDPDPFFQFGYVAQTKNKATRMVFLNADVLAGDSGGPCIDSAGRLVAVNSRIYPWWSSGLAASAPVEQIREFADSFLPKTK